MIGKEVASDKAMSASLDLFLSNVGLVPNALIDPATGQIDFTRASWSRASWSDATDLLRASWSCASWSSTDSTAVDPTRASWSRASWSTSFEK